MARQAEKLTLLLALILIAPAQAQAGEQSRSAKLNSRGWGFSAPAVLNGAMEPELVIDSGSTFTVISPAVAKRIGVNDLDRAPRYPLSSAGGIVWVRLIVFDSVSVGGAIAHGVEGAVADLPSFKGAGGLLGKSFLDRFSFKIDGGAKALELAPHKSRPLFGGRGEGWWRSRAKSLAQQASLFRAMELGADQSVYMGDVPERLLKEKLSKNDAGLLAVFFGGLLESLRKEADELHVPEEWLL